MQHGMRLRQMCLIASRCFKSHRKPPWRTALNDVKIMLTGFRRSMMRNSTLRGLRVSKKLGAIQFGLKREWHLMTAVEDVTQLWREEKRFIKKRQV